MKPASGYNNLLIYLFYGVEELAEQVVVTRYLNIDPYDGLSVHSKFQPVYVHYHQSFARHIEQVGLTRFPSCSQITSIPWDYHSLMIDRNK